MVCRSNSIHAGSYGVGGVQKKKKGFGFHFLTSFSDPIHFDVSFQQFTYFMPDSDHCFILMVFLFLFNETYRDGIGRNVPPVVNSRDIQRGSYLNKEFAIKKQDV